MIKREKCIVFVIAALFVLSFCVPLYADQSEKSTVEKLLDILQQKGIITEEQHGDLTEELGVEEKELEEQKQIVQEVKAKEEKRPQVGYKNGFYLKTPDDKHKLKIGGRVFADFRAYNSGHPSDSEFYISRARIYLSGTLYSYFDFKVQADFGKGDSNLKDGFINVKYFPFAQFKMGQFKAPFSLERMSSSKYMPFIERALPVDNLTPDRDIGFMVHGSYKPFGL
ncbi:MAG: porin, partial [Thermodesulfobacteriota bacterium]|nr:porin [Thermodesulfobacteriota bacterium]